MLPVRRPLPSTPGSTAACCSTREHAYDELDTDEDNNPGDEDDETEFEERIDAEFTEAIRAAGTAAGQWLL
jgi:hypothetical protein